MNKKTILALVAALHLAAGSAMPAPTQGRTSSNRTAVAPASPETAYTRALEKRAAGILASLHLNDPVKTTRVREIIINQYRQLRAWHEAHDAPIKALEKRVHGPNREAAEQARARIAQIRSSLKALHHQYLAELSANLTPAQVDKVKDKMTYNQMEATYHAYCEIVPDLTAAQKAKMLELLKQAREEAMDCGSGRAKADVFRQYKGKINNYLTAQGHNVGQAFKAWGERQREKQRRAKAQ